MARQRRPSAQQVCSNGQSYEVQQHDTLTGIAAGATGSGSNFDQIQNLDGSAMANPNLIHPGQLLDVSGVCGEEEEVATESGVEGAGSGVTTAQPADGAPPPDEQGDAPLVSDAPARGQEEAPDAESPVAEEQAEGNTSGGGAGGDVSLGAVPSVQSTPSMTAPGSGGGSITSGNASCDELLNEFATNEQLDAVLCQTDLLDELNAFRNNDLGAAGINVVERLIPGYGAYDAVRDNWNGYWNFVERAPDDFILQLIAGFEMWIGMAADVVRHLGYVFSIIQWLAAATGIGAVPSAIGGYSIGLLINGLLAVLDGANAAMGLFGAAYSGLMLSFADLDEAERARYEFAMVHQTEHAIVSTMHVGVDIAAAVVGNYIPSEALKSGARVALAGAATGTRGLAVGASRYLMGEASEGADFGVAPEPWMDSGMQLPKDIIGDAAYMAEHPMGPIFRVPLFSDETRDRLYNGTQRPCAQDATITGQIMDPIHWEIDPMLLIADFAPLDHSPNQVSSLAALEADIDAGIAETTSNQAALAVDQGNQESAIAGMTMADGVFGGLAEEQASVSQRLGAALPGVDQGLSQQGQAATAVTAVNTGLSGVSDHMGQAQSVSSAQVESPSRDEGRSWWQKAGDWVVDNTIGALFGRLNGALSAGSGPAAAGGSAAATGLSTGQAAATEIDGQAAPLQETATGGREDQAAAQAAAAQHQSDQAQVAQVRAISEQRLATAQANQVQEQAQLDQLLAYRAEVAAERQRQEAENARFAATVGPEIARANVGGGVNQQQREALLAALDAVSDLSDGAVGQVASAASGVPSHLVPEASAFVSAFADSEARRMASVMGAVNRANSWEAFQIARGALMGAEAGIRDQLQAALAFLGEMAQAPTEEEASQQVAASDTEDLPGGNAGSTT